MELKELGFKLDDHIYETGSELDMWRSEITQTEFKLKVPASEDQLVETTATASRNEVAL